MPDKFHYECCNCGATFSPDGIKYLCPSCSKSNRPDKPPLGVLKTIYPYEKIRSMLDRKDPFGSLKRDGFLPLLPLRSMGSWPALKVGDTPLYRSADDFHTLAGDTVFFKDDSRNPTFSFKDRASALVSAWARENGIRTVIAASTGNAGSSLAGICASQRQRSVIFVPAGAPMAKLTQIMMYGAQIVPVNGTYDDAYELSRQATERFGFYNRNTALNPFTIEGKKTVSFEIYEQMAHQIPDRIFVPVGDGVILSSVYKGFEDLLKLGIISYMPVVVAVQSSGSSNLVNNLGKDSFMITPSATIADSISVDVPRNFYMAAQYLKSYRGETMLVTDEEILDASGRLASRHGIFSEPAAAAAFAGLIRFNEQVSPGERPANVVLLTGSGLKDLRSVQSRIRIPEPVDPDIRSLEKIFTQEKNT